MVTYTSFTGSLNKILQVSEDLKSSSNDTPPTEKQSVSSFQIPLGLIAKTSFNSSINEKNLMVSSPTDGSLSLLENNAAQSLSSDKASGDLMLLSGGGAGGGFGSDEKKRKESIDIIRTSLGGIPSHRHRAFSDYNSNSNQASQIRGGSISSRTSSNNNNSSNNRSKGSVQSSASSVAGKRVVQTSLGHITFDSIVPRNPTLKSTTNNNNLNFSRQLSSPSPPARQDNAAQGHRREDSSGIGFPRPSETVTTATTTTDLVLNNIYARRKSVTPLKPAAERVTIEEEAQKNAAAAYIEKSQKQAGTETVSPPASKSTIDFVGYKTKPEKSFIESLRVPIDESPETKWDLKFSTEVENLYTVYAYHLIGRMNVLPMAIFCILWLAFVVLEFFSYSSFQPARAIIAIFPAATTLLITIWSRFSSYEKYHKRANVIWAITLSMELISATIHEYFLFKNTNDQNGITPDRFPSVLALALIGSVYLTVSTRFTRLFIIATTLTLFQTAMEFAICAKSGSNISYISAVQNSLLYFVMNTIGVYFRFSSEVYLRRAFVRYQKQYSSAEKLLIAQQHSEHLLGMIFPSKIISTLKKLDLTGSEKASLHDTFLELKGVTILFADIVGFTEFSSQVPQSKLIRLLGEIFAEFDSIAHDMDLEKIKTIGDCVQVNKK